MPTYYEGSVGSVKTQITREEFPKPGGWTRKRMGG